MEGKIVRVSTGMSEQGYKYRFGVRFNYTPLELVELIKQTHLTAEELRRILIRSSAAISGMVWMEAPIFVPSPERRRAAPYPVCRSAAAQSPWLLPLPMYRSVSFRSSLRGSILHG